MIAPSKYGQQAMTKLQAVSRSRRKPAGELMAWLDSECMPAKAAKAELS